MDDNALTEAARTHLDSKRVLPLERVGYTASEIPETHKICAASPKVDTRHPKDASVPSSSRHPEPVTVPLGATASEWSSLTGAVLKLACSVISSITVPWTRSIEALILVILSHFSWIALASSIKASISRSVRRLHLPSVLQ